MHITSLFSTYCSQLTVLYLATWRAAKLGIFTHFTFTNLRRCSQSISLQIYALYRSLAAFYECLITLLCTSATQKNCLYYPLPGQKTCESLKAITRYSLCSTRNVKNPNNLTIFIPDTQKYWITTHHSQSYFIGEDAPFFSYFIWGWILPLAYLVIANLVQIGILVCWYVSVTCLSLCAGLQMVTQSNHILKEC